MNAPVRKPIPALLLAGLLLSSWQLGGCLSDADDDSVRIDPFPRPNGPKIIPLETDYQAVYHFTRLDTQGNVVLRIPELTLHVARQASDTFGYAFEDPNRGWLIRYLETDNRDSSGIWIVGSYRYLSRSYLPSPVRWLPQHPDSGKTWSVGEDRTLELDASEAEYLTDVILTGDTEAAPIVQGMQKHTAIRFKELAGDTLSYYYFRKGVGLLGYERSVGGKLVAAGSIRSFLRVPDR